MKLITALVAAALALGTFLVPLAAAETVTKTWIQTSQTDFLQGTGEGVDVHSSPGNVRMGGAELPTQLSKWRHDQGGYVWSQQGSPYVLSGEGSIYWGRSVSWCSYCRYTDVLTTDAAGKESVTVYLYAAGGYASGYYNAYERAYFRFSDGANTQNFLLRAIELDHWSSGYRNVFGNYQAVETHNGWSWYKFVFDVPSHFNKANLRAGLVLESYTGGTWSCGCNLEMWNYVAFGAPATGMFTSNVHNAGGFADFESIRYSGIVPAGASLKVQTRTSADGVAFSPWADALSGEPLPSPAGHFVQYRVLFSRASLTSAPYLEDVSVTYGFTVDTTAPRTVANAVGPLGCSGWMNGPATVTASATDDLSGVASTLVSVDGGFFAPYAEPFAVGDGEHAVDYYSVDHAGNVEAARAIAFKVDSAAPVSAIDVGAPSYRGDRLYVTPDTPFTLHADDATSGVKVTRVDTGGGFRAYDAPFRLAEEGARTVRYQSEDRACNAEAERVLDVVVDATAPVTTATVLGDAGCDGWLVSRPVVSLDASDALSGVAATYVSVDGGAFAPYAGPVAFDDGRHSVSYYSVDRAGNAEAPRTVDVKADTAPPATTHAIDGATFEADRLYVGPTTAFTLAAEDATSGVKATRVDVGSGFAAYAGPFSLGTDGAYTVSYASEDAACLVEETRAFDVFVDGTAPSVAITSPTSGVRALGHESADVEELDLAQAQLAEFGLYGSDVDTLVHIARVGAAEVCGAADADRCAALALAALAPRVGGPVIVGDVTIRADAADPDVNGGASGLAYVAFYLDGAIQAVDAEAPFEWAWNSANATMGGHDVAALAMDNLGNSATSVVSVSVVPIGATGALDTGDAALVTAEAPVFSQLLYDFVRAKLSGASGVRPPLPEPPVLPAPPPEVCVEGTCIMVPGVPPVDPPPEVPTPPLPPLPEPPTEVCVEGTCVPLAPPGVPDCVGDICPPIDEPVKPCFEPCIPTVPPLPEPPTEVCVEGACLPPDPDALPALPGLPPGVPPPPPTLPPVEPPAVPPVDPPALPPADPPADPPAIPEPQPPSAPDTGELPETPTAPEVPPVCIDDQCLAVEG